MKPKKAQEIEVEAASSGTVADVQVKPKEKVLAGGTAEVKAQPKKEQEIEVDAEANVTVAAVKVKPKETVLEAGTAEVKAQPKEKKIRWKIPGTQMGVFLEAGLHRITTRDGRRLSRSGNGRQLAKQARAKGAKVRIQRRRWKT